MGLHAKVLLVALLRLLLLGVAVTLCIPGGAGRSDQSGVDDGAGGQLEALDLQVRTHLLEDLTAQLMALQQVAKVQNTVVSSGTRS